jgi:hypothetical protein
LYGPPAVGKFTVAKELSKLTGYKVLHNHLIINLVLSVFEHGDPKFYKYTYKHMLELIGIAARSNVKGMIFTFVYGNFKDDDRFVRNVVKLVNKSFGKVYFVRLYADISVLKRRIKNKARKKFDKPRNAKILDDLMMKYDLFSSISFVKQLEMNTTKLNPKRAARIIKETYDL